jgi:hypothetical protein
MLLVFGYCGNSLLHPNEMLGEFNWHTSSVVSLDELDVTKKEKKSKSLIMPTGTVFLPCIPVAWIPLG